MKTLESAYQLLKFCMPIWFSCWYLVDSLIVYKISDDDVNNEVGIENRMRTTFPGTKWCGPGNISTGYDDLGHAENTDKCCREHDFCPDVIVKFGTKHNLTNNAFYSRLSCDCDQKFYNCLKENKDIMSDNIGIMYFDALSTQCFKEEYPIVECQQYNKILVLRCEKYLLDETQPKKWQWFDVPIYPLLLPQS